MSKPTQPTQRSPPAWRDHAEGVALFLFIPLVLYLFVGRPQPLALSLAAGVFLMLGHRLIARPYMRRVAPRVCLWTHRRLDGAADAIAVELHTGIDGSGRQQARCLARHAEHVGRFFTCLRLMRPVVALGIFLPLALLLGSLAWAATGGRPPVALEKVTAIFQLSVGVTVNLVAFGYLAVRRIDDPLRVAVPAHNFFLLGIRALLWIFRLVGLVWIARGLFVLL